MTTKEVRKRTHNSGNLFKRLGNIEYASPHTLIPYANSPRKHSAKKLAKLAANISEFGLLTPLLVDSGNTVIAGEARLQVAKDLGLDAVPILRAYHLSDGQVKAYRIADNRLVELGTWDLERLATDFEAIIECGDIAIELSGFEVGEVDVILSGEPADKPDPDDELIEPEKAISRTGDLWHLDKHRLLCGSCGDATAWAQLMEDEQAAMLFTDPAYDIKVSEIVNGSGRHKEFAKGSGDMSSPEFTGFLIGKIAAAAAYLKDGGIAAVCMNFVHMRKLHAEVDRCGLTELDLCVWDKGPEGTGSLYRSQHELVLITKKGRAPHTNNVQLGKHGRSRTNVWSYPGANCFSKTHDADLADHPTVKPTALVADAIREVTHPGEIVIDGFMGSGTTILACERSKRVGYGIEIDGGYVDVAIRRWEKMTGGKAVLAQTGESFAQVAVRRKAGDDFAPSAPVIRQRSRPASA